MSDSKKGIISRMDSAGRLFENILLVTLLGAMMLLSVGQIIAREVFETGLFWSGELVRIMVLWLAMIGAVAACREDRHIRIDAISHLMSARTVSVVRLVVDTFAAVVCATVAWHAWRYIQLEIEFEDTVLVDTPAWMAHIVVPIGFALLSYRFLVRVAIEAMKLKSGERAESS